jgi:hypothetical protein
VSWRASQVKESYERILVVYIHSLKICGTIDTLGAFASVIKYKLDGIDHEEVIDNEDFTILDEIVLTHIEEN